MKSKKEKKRTANTIPGKFLPIKIYALWALNDGRIAIGGDRSLSIYNMKTYKVDIKIDFSIQVVKFILQLSDNKLFYYTYSHETEGAYTDVDYYNYLIELSGNTYKDVSKILGGINYSLIENDSYYCTNAKGKKRIEKLEKYEKNNEQQSEDEDNLQEKYQITKSMDIDFVDFLVLNKDLIVVLLIDRLDFYDVKEFKKVKSSPIISNNNDCLKFAIYSENLILIGTGASVEIFDIK